MQKEGVGKQAPTFAQIKLRIEPIEVEKQEREKEEFSETGKRVKDMDTSSDISSISHSESTNRVVEGFQDSPKVNEKIKVSEDEFLMANLKGKAAHQEYEFRRSLHSLPFEM